MVGTKANFDAARNHVAADRQDDHSLLDRTIVLAYPRWETVAWVTILVVAGFLRLASLNRWALGIDEARRAWNAWLLYQGQPPVPGDVLPDTAPLVLELQALGFFLFGATDVTARLIAPLAGLAIIGLIWMLRPVIGPAASLGMAALVAISPTIVHNSRLGTPEILTACCALLVLVCLLRAGAAHEHETAVQRWAVATGAAVAALIATGPAALTVLISLAVGLAVAAAASRGSAGLGLNALLHVRGALLSAVAAGVATLVILFTRFFSDLPAIVGIGQTVADWVRLVANSTVPTPIQFFLLALLLYEPLAVVLGLLVVFRGRVSRTSGLGGPLFGGWFAASLVLWSFSSGRSPNHTVFVALPLVLLAGGVLGEVIATVAWRDTLRGRGGPLALAMLGFVIGLFAIGVLIGRVDTALDQRAASLQAALVAMLVVVPLAYAIVFLIGRERADGRRRQPWLLALMVVTLLLAAFTLRSTMLLNFYRADDGTELLAQRTPTAAVLPLVERIQRLSRDTTLLDGSVRDTTGGNGLSIAVARNVRWPFQWYFREFPNFTLIDPGQVPLADAQILIAPSADGMPEAGYTPRDYPWLQRTPPSFTAPDVGAIFGTLFNPRRWNDGLQFLLYRDGISLAEPETVAVGLTGELAARVYPATGPYNLSDSPGPGSARGQFNQPIGIAAAEEGTVYVVDQGNARVQRFDADGLFIDVWGEVDSEVQFARTESGLGPTGIATGPDGLVYVADTWNHRIVVLNASGQLIREIGSPPDSAGNRQAVDTTDDPAAVETETGFFFGPRDVAVSEEEIYVVDTGNERIQVFAPDGTFKRVWGGYGTGPDQFIEPVGIAIGPNGLIWVADSGNARVSVFTPMGAPVQRFTVEAWPAPDPAGARPSFQPYLSFDQNGLLYVTSAQSGSVEVYNRDGTFIESITDVEGDTLEQPIGISATANGDLLITDIESSTVHRYTPDAPPPVVEIERTDASPVASPIGEASLRGATLPSPPDVSFPSSS